MIPKHVKFVDEYMVDLNATQSAIRAGYSEKSARSTASRLLTLDNIKAEIASRMKASRISSDEVIKRMEAMALGDLPTKTVTGSHSRKEYDTKAATDSLGKIYALFIDKTIIELDGLEIIDEDPQAEDPSPSPETA